MPDSVSGSRRHTDAIVECRQKLRAAGFDDSAILLITLIASWSMLALAMAIRLAEP